MTALPTPDRRAVILGGTGAMGVATALRLAESGWRVEVTGRNPAAVAPALGSAGVRYHCVDRGDTEANIRLVGDDTDLLVDLAALRGRDVVEILPAIALAGSSVLVSSWAVYLDGAGRHINGEAPPRFPVPITEQQATVVPGPDTFDPQSREGYAPGKAAAEEAARNSGFPMTIVRPAKVHGPWARNPRTRDVVRKMLSGQRVIEIADGGTSVDHLTAAASVAAVIQASAERPAARVLNVADPDPLTAREIFRAIADELGWPGELRPVTDFHRPARGDHPWRAQFPIVLDTSRAQAFLGEAFVPGRKLIGDEVRWLVDQW